MNEILLEKVKEAFVEELPEVQVDINIDKGLLHNSYLCSCIFDIDIFDPEEEGDDEEVNEIIIASTYIFDEVFINVIDPDEGTIHLLGLIFLEDEENEEVEE